MNKLRLRLRLNGSSHIYDRVKYIYYRYSSSSSQQENYNFNDERVNYEIIWPHRRLLHSSVRSLNIGPVACSKRDRCRSVEESRLRYKGSGGNSSNVQTVDPICVEWPGHSVNRGGPILLTRERATTSTMKSLDKTARFHVLYQNKGYDIVVKVVTALLALVRALTKKIVRHTNLLPRLFNTIPTEYLYTSRERCKFCIEYKRFEK